MKFSGPLKNVICGLSVLLIGEVASAACQDYSGKYQRVDDKFTIEWSQQYCSSMVINEHGLGTVTVQIDGVYRQISSEPAQKAFIFLDGKFVYSYIMNDATSSMTIVYTKTPSGGLRGDISRCDQYSCRKSVDLYEPL